MNLAPIISLRSRGVMPVAYGLLVACLITVAPALAKQSLPGSAPLARFLAASPEAVAVVLVSTPGCPICEVVRREQLLPLLTDDSFADIAVFEVQMQDERDLLPLTGEHLQAGQTSPISPRRLAKNQSIRLAPTLLFFNRRKRLAEPLVGYASADFYWSYLSDRIRTARANAH